MAEKRTLDRSAYEALPEGQTYQPYILADESLPEFTVKAVVPGIFLSLPSWMIFWTVGVTIRISRQGTREGDFLIEGSSFWQTIALRLKRSD